MTLKKGPLRSLGSINKISKKRGSNYDYDTMVKQQLKIKEQYKVWEHTEV